LRELRELRELPGQQARRLRERHPTAEGVSIISGQVDD
jgi:hypothetical protein